MASSEPKRCLGCGYILDHLPEPRCPECGRRFDPHDPDTYGPESYVPKRTSGRAHLAAAICGIVGPAIIVAIACAETPPYAQTMFQNLVSWVVVTAAFAMFLTELLVLDHAIEALRGRRGEVRDPKMLVAAMLVSVLFWAAVLYGVVREAMRGMAWG